MQVVSRRTTYPKLEIPVQTWLGIIGFFGFGILMVVASVSDRLDRGDWSDLPSTGWLIFTAGIYLTIAAAIIYKLRHPDRPPAQWGEVEAAGEKTQARIAGILERRRQSGDRG